MREIKFRGKNIAGNWFYGLLTRLTEDIPRVDKGFYISNSKGMPFAYHVQPETVGQFTGLKDKTGKDIWEGDIIEHYRNDSDDESDSSEEWKVRCVVKWQDGISNHLPHKDDNPSTANCNPQFIGELIRGQKDGSYNWSEFHNCEVIGNIYEHQELLKRIKP